MYIAKINKTDLETTSTKKVSKKNTLLELKQDHKEDLEDLLKRSQQYYSTKKMLRTFLLKTIKSLRTL